MSKYIIKNCPAFDEGDCVSPTEHIPYATACEHIEDCKLKQIVELCKPVKKEYSKHKLDVLIAGKFNIAGKILLLLDIQEVE